MDLSMNSCIRKVKNLVIDLSIEFDTIASSLTFLIPDPFGVRCPS